MLHPVAPMAAVMEGDRIPVRINGQELVVGMTEGRYFAISSTCPHAGASLARGTLNGFELTCPRHGARFDVRDGRCIAPEATQSVACFRVLLEAGKVCVEV